MAAADHAHGDVAFGLPDLRQPGLEVGAPGVAQPLPVFLRRAGRLPGSAAVQLHLPERAMELVPFDLEGDQAGDDVIDVRWRRDQDRQPVSAIVVVAAPPGGRLDAIPAQDVLAQDCVESVRALAQEHAPAASHDGR